MERLPHPSASRTRMSGGVAEQRRRAARPVVVPYADRTCPCWLVGLGSGLKFSAPARTVALAPSRGLHSVRRRLLFSKAHARGHGCGTRRQQPHERRHPRPHLVHSLGELILLAIVKGETGRWRKTARPPPSEESEAERGAAEENNDGNGGEDAHPPLAPDNHGNQQDCHRAEHQRRAPRHRRRYAATVVGRHICGGDASIHFALRWKRNRDGSSW